LYSKIAVGVVALAASMAIAAPVSAQTTSLTLSFDHVVLDTEATGDAQVVSDATAPLKLTVAIDSDTGDFTVNPTGFSAPAYTFTSPVAGSATIALAGPGAGNIDFSTGAVTLTGEFLATIDLGSDGSCVVDTGPQTLSTANTQPLAGKAFPLQPSGLTAGTVALGVGWSTLPASSAGPACPLINPAVDTPGGIWISRGISPEPITATLKPPRLNLSIAKPAGVRPGARAVVAATLANTGGADLKPVKVCLAARAPLAPTRRCLTVKDPAGGSRHNLVFTLSTTRSTGGKHQLTLSARGATPRTTTLAVAR
jgi:hypothetical protein